MQFANQYNFQELKEFMKIRWTFPFVLRCIYVIHLWWLYTHNQNTFNKKSQRGWTEHVFVDVRICCGSTCTDRNGFPSDRDSNCMEVRMYLTTTATSITAGKEGFKKGLKKTLKKASKKVQKRLEIGFKKGGLAGGTGWAMEWRASSKFTFQLLHCILCIAVIGPSKHCICIFPFYVCLDLYLYLYLQRPLHWRGVTVRCRQWCGASHGFWYLYLINTGANPNNNLCPKIKKCNWANRTNPLLIKSEEIQLFVKS